MRKPPLLKRTAFRQTRNSPGSIQRNAKQASQFAGKSPIEYAKERLTIHELWTRLNLPGRPAKSCRCPWREDRNPSFSIHPDGQLWNDFATGEGGDAVDFLAKASGLSNGDAARRFIELAGGSGEAPKVLRTEAQAKPAPILPDDLKPGGASEWRKLSRLRSIATEAIEMAANAGHLRFCEYRNQAAWVILDSTGRNIGIRRLDGKPWWRDGAKTMAVPNVDRKWPIGAADIGDKPFVALCEGEPDLLAAWALIYAEGRSDVAPVAMLGGCTEIGDAALPFFQGKRVRIFAHHDPKGQGMNSAIKWTSQLNRAGAEVDTISLEGFRQYNGAPVSDLNDFLRLDYDQWEALECRFLLPTEGGLK